jgi:RHS repeat-associated protein
MNGASSASFAYDAFDRRRSKSVGGTTINLLYDGENLAQELSGSTPTANFLAGLDVDEIFTRTDVGSTSTLLVDSLGSTLAVADVSATVQTQYTFQPFGTSAVSGAFSANVLEFTGRENDGTGLYYYRARYLNPSVGRFVSEDPADDGTNLYTYVENDPTNLVDPSGTQAIPYPIPYPAPWFPGQPVLSKPHEMPHHPARDFNVRESPYPKDKPKQCQDWRKRSACLAGGHLTPTGEHPNPNQYQLLVYALGYGDTEMAARKAALDNVQSAVPSSYTAGWWYVRHPKIIKCWTQ